MISIHAHEPIGYRPTAAETASKALWELIRQDSVEPVIPASRYSHYTFSNGITMPARGRDIVESYWCGVLRQDEAVFNLMSLGLTEEQAASLCL